MPIGHSEVQIWHCVQSSVFLTLKKDSAVGTFKNAPHGHKNLQNPFFPRKYTIKNPSTKNVKLPIKKLGRNFHISGSFSEIVIVSQGFKKE